MLCFHFWVHISKESKLRNFQKIIISDNNSFQWNEKRILVLFLTKFCFSLTLNFPWNVKYNQTELFWFAPRSHLKLTFNKVNCRERAAAIIYLTIDFLSPFVKTRNCPFPFAIYFPFVLCRCVWMSLSSSSCPHFYESKTTGLVKCGFLLYVEWLSLDITLTKRLSHWRRFLATFEFFRNTPFESLTC